MKQKLSQQARVLADSGGSKTDWVLLDRGRVVRELKTTGLNPSLVGPECIRSILHDQVKPWLHGVKITEIRFFGAGLTRKTPQARMRKLLITQLGIFPEDQKNIYVEPDILGAGLACLGHEKGFIGILGTGSIAFKYNGKKVTKTKGGLGYLIGDVGGGVALGRVFLRRLVNRDLPKLILDNYPEYTGLKINEVIATLYNHAAPAQFLAAQAPFIALHQGDPSIHSMIVDQFNGFIEVYLMPLLVGSSDPVVFMGGVARTFEHQLLQICVERQLKHARVHKAPPIIALTEFFSNSGDVT